jgi:hypothetical protein
MREQANSAAPSVTPVVDRRELVQCSGQVVKKKGRYS